MEHPKLSTALVRDNKPMQEKALLRCLHGMAPREWYERLDCRVLFWVEWKRLLKLLGVRAYWDRPHLVMKVDMETWRHGDMAAPLWAQRR